MQASLKQDNENFIGRQITDKEVEILLSQVDTKQGSFVDLMKKLVPKLFMLSQVEKFSQVPIFLDFDDTLSHKVHPETNELHSAIMAQMALPENQDKFEEILIKSGECVNNFSSDIVKLINCIQSLSQYFTLVIVTRRETGHEEIIKLFEENKLSVPEILGQKTIGGAGKSEEIEIGGETFKTEFGKTLTISKGTVINEWFLKNSTPNSAIFCDDIGLHVDEVCKYINDKSPCVQMLYGTISALSDWIEYNPNDWVITSSGAVEI